MNWAYQQKVGDGIAKSVLVALANQADQDGKCWPSIDYIQKRTEFARATVVDRLGKLYELGYLEKIKRAGDGGGRKSNVYRLCLDRQSSPDELWGKVHHVNQQSSPREPEQSIQQSIKDKGRGISDLICRDLAIEAEFDKIRKGSLLNPNDNRKTALRAFRARVRAGVGVEELAAGWLAYQAQVKAAGTNRKFVKHQATFFGPDEHWRQSYEVPGSVPHDRPSILALCEQHDIHIRDNDTLNALRKAIAHTTGMTLA